MIYKFRLLSNESDDFLCDIEIPENNTFLEFHNAIQEAMKYDNSMITSFYLCDENWEKIQEISLMDMGSDAEQLFFMADTVLKDFMHKKYEKLIYVFDLLSERGFFIELLSALKKDQKIKYPICTAINGKIPQQSSFDDIELEF